MSAPYVLFFSGLDGLIDKPAAERLAKNRGCEAIFYGYAYWQSAAKHVADNPDTPYHVVGFSRGAAPDVLGGLMHEVRKHGSRLPEDLMTVGLYGPIGGGFTHRYVDPHFECINYLDESGQRHVGEHNAVNLGAHVPHLDPVKRSMARVARMFANGQTPLAPKLAAPSLPPPQSKSAVADFDHSSSAEVGQARPRSGEGGEREAESRLRTSPEFAVPSVPPLHLSPASGGESRPSPAARTVLTKQAWPPQARATAFYGNPGTRGWAAAHLVHVRCPWTLHMDGVTLHHIQINARCAASLTRVLAWVWEECGRDAEKISALRYDRFSGSHAYRPMRGGTALSMHAYGAAIDWDDADNQQHSHKHLFTAESPLIKAFLDEGWEWGGNWSGASIDAMHVQAARVR